MPAEIPDGAVIVARAIINSSIWTMRSDDRVVALTCIVLANYRDRTWFDGKAQVALSRGQFVRSWARLAKDCGLTMKTTRTSVQHLENVGFLARKQAGRYSLFTIPKYQHYQDLTKYSDSIVEVSGKTSGSERAASGQQTIREERKKKNTPPSPPRGAGASCRSCLQSLRRDGVYLIHTPSGDEPCRSCNSPERLKAWDDQQALLKKFAGGAP